MSTRVVAHELRNDAALLPEAANMMDLWRAGGFPMYLILAFGMLGLGAAIRLAIKADPRGYDFVKYISLAIVWSIFSGTVSDFAATFYYLTKMPESTDWGHWRATLAEGLAESMSPPILGGTFLALIALFSAVAAARIERKGL